MKEEPASDQDLLRRLAAGDEAGFIELYRRRQAAVYRFALHMAGSKAVAEDVTQEVFLALMRDVRSYDPSRGPVAAFLLGLARNYVLRALRRERGAGAEPGEELTASDDPLAEAARRELVESVRGAVLALPVHYREAIVLCDLEEMDYAEAASALGCSIGTVRSRLSRGRALLAEKLRAARGPAPSAGAIKPVRCSA